MINFTILLSATAPSVIYEQLANGILSIIFTGIIMFFSLQDIKSPHKTLKNEIVETFNPRYGHYLIIAIESVFLPYYLFHYSTSYYEADYTNTVLNTNRIVGMIVFLFGMALRIIAKRQLGHYFTYNITIKPNHSLIRTGLYTYLMHPSYTGVLCTYAGKVLFFLPSLVPVISFSVVLFTVPLRIMHEENALKSKFGKQFEEYKRGRWRLIPLII